MEFHFQRRYEEAIKFSLKITKNEFLRLYFNPLNADDDERRFLIKSFTYRALYLYMKCSWRVIEEV